MDMSVVREVVSQAGFALCEGTMPNEWTIAAAGLFRTGTPAPNGTDRLSVGSLFLIEGNPQVFALLFEGYPRFSFDLFFIIF